MTELLIFIIYLGGLFAIAIWNWLKQKSDSDFILGGRSLNFWLTALSAHASDMSSWLFLAYPSVIFLFGPFQAWAGIGLTVMMYLNWQFIAPRIRTISEQTDSLTLNAYFENRFADSSGSIRTVSALMSLVFFIIYISSGLVGLGLLVEALLGYHYFWGISIGLLIVVAYVFLGGYTAVAWIDLIQGFFLLGVIIFIPAYLIPKLGGMGPIVQAMHENKLSTSLFPDFSARTLLEIFFIAFGWGLGYFGQPHIITKFMGIKKVGDINKAKIVGISWQILALGGATFLGLIGIYLFQKGLDNPERVVLDIVQQTLPGVVTGLVLCAILAATTNVMAAQILVVASSLAEDFYKRLFRKTASSKELLWISRFGVIFTGLLAFIIAFFKVSTIYQLVLYAWTGLGCSFGPLLLISLYSKSVNKYGAFYGIFIGGITAAFWYAFSPKIMGLAIPAMIPGFLLSSLAILLATLITRKKEISNENTAY